MGPEIRIREIDSSHIAGLIQIAEDTNLNRWTAAHYLDELKNTDAIMLRLESLENETVGFIVGRIVPSLDNEAAADAEIYNIGIDPRFQRMGCGQTLIEAFMTACRKRHVEKVWLEVRVSNEPARRIYEKNGFRAVSTRKAFYTDPTEDGVLMRCDIGRPT